MTDNCAYCEVDNQTAVVQTIIDTKDDGQIRWLDAKRSIEEEHGLEAATVTGLKRHTREHVQVTGGGQ